MDRRAFLLALVVTCGCSEKDASKRAADATQPSAAFTPPTKIPRVSILVFGAKDSASVSAPVTAPALFRNRLSELGYVEGRTILIDESYGDGEPQQLARLARDIVERKPDVIVAIAAAATAAAREATSTIPIVMVHAGNPVGSGLVTSLARPGGNVTGTTSMVPDLGVKQVELLRELIPRLAKLGVLANPTNAGAPPYLAGVNEAARRFNTSVVLAEVTRPDDFDRAFALLADAHPDALLIMAEPLIGMHRARVLDFAVKNRLPASFDVGRDFVREGGLISYGPVLATHYAIAAEYVDKILKGANPADLPVYQPTQFALLINLKTAKELALTVPESLRQRADELIQ